MIKKKKKERKGAEWELWGKTKIKLELIPEIKKQITKIISKFYKENHKAEYKLVEMKINVNISSHIFNKISTVMASWLLCNGKWKDVTYKLTEIRKSKK